MENLTPDVREVILPKDFQQLTIGEIGDEPGITVTEDKSRRHRAWLITRALLLSVPPTPVVRKKNSPVLPHTLGMSWAGQAQS